MNDNRFRSHTKKGPGRFHGQGKLLVVRPYLTDVYLVKQSEKRLAPAIVGDFHGATGKQYLTYAEHDRCVRDSMDCMEPTKAGRDYCYRMARDAIIDNREAA